MKVEVGKRVNFQIESDEEDFAKTFESQYSVTMSFTTHGGVFFSIPEIKLDRER